MVPPAFVLRDAAARALAAEWLRPDERSDLRIFHGVWDDRDLDTPQRQAAAALARFELEDPIFDDDAVTAELRAEARILAGRPEQALELLAHRDSIRVARLRAEALEMLGRLDEADAAVAEPVALLSRRNIDSPADLVDGIRALMVRARVQGQPARDFQTMVTLLGRAHQDLDRLYWPALVVEGTLLAEKGNAREAVAALHQALELNPRGSEAWYALGRIGLSVFDFDGVGRAVAALRRVNPRHPLAALLLAEMRIVQDDPEAAIAVLEPVLATAPAMRPALAMNAAAHAVSFDEAATEEALRAIDAVSPGSADAWYLVGRHLSLQRQYEAAAEALEEAIRRRPRWPEPQIELGLLEMQSGRDNRARQALEAVVALDPFNRRAINSLELLREIEGFDEIESEHFRIRHRPGVDAVVAELMPDALDAMHADLVQRFKHEPDRKTIIELMPDHRFFAVRITGMPSVHTIAACTGPVIALETPREGPPHLHRGPYDWLQVLRHEYAHTITLSQTRNRIPHWLTEAAAVSIETAPRSMETCQLLAREWSAGTLLDLDEINWAFTRPRRPQDRQLAYMQGAWMVEYINERFGPDALVTLIDRYFDGVREADAMPQALGITREAFFRDFLAWAGAQLTAWGMTPEPPMEALLDRLRAEDSSTLAMMDAARRARSQRVADAIADRIGAPMIPPDVDDAPIFDDGDRPRHARRPDATSTRVAGLWPALPRPPVEIDDATLAAWLREFPHHPDLIELRLRRLDEFETALDSEHERLLRELIRLRPVDPYPHRALARHFLEQDDGERAVEHLRVLDALEVNSTAYALELARLHRDAGRLDEALDSATKAIRINGYAAATRELAAAIAIEAERFDVARLHIEALIRLEPDRGIHRRRLEALARMAG